MSITFAAVICDADDPCSVNTAQDPESSFYNVNSEYDPAFSTFDTGVPAPNSRDDRDPSVRQNELFYPWSLLQRSALSCFWLSSAAMLVFSRLFTIPCPLLPLLLVFSLLEALE